MHPIDWSLVPEYAGAFGFGYLCGSIPFGLLLTRLVGAPDLRTIGSGNIGATNVLRTGRKALAAATLAGDVLKGTAAIVIVNAIFGRDIFGTEIAICTGLGAFLGHLFPIWLRFKGGKGVAIYVGLLLGFGLWLALLAFCAIWLVIAVLTRYSSLASLLASAATPAMLWWNGVLPEAELFLLLSALIWIMHRANIARLARGTESRIGGKSET